MNTALNTLVFLIALQHAFFLIVEMFFWTKPLGLKMFKLDPSFAAESAAMAANQGLYNGFLAAGLIWALVAAEAPVSFNLKLFFLSCVFVAGIYGAATVSRTILYVQAFPAALALAVLFFSSRTLS